MGDSGNYTVVDSNQTSRLLATFDHHHMECMRLSSLAQDQRSYSGSALVKRFADYYKPHKKLFTLDFGSAVLSGVLELAFPLAVQLFIDDLLPSGDWGPIIGAAVALAMIYLVNTGLMVVVT